MPVVAAILQLGALSFFPRFVKIWMTPLVASEP